MPDRGLLRVLAPLPRDPRASLPVPRPHGRGHQLRTSLLVQQEVSLAGQAVGVKQVDHGIRLVSFMDYDLGYIDLEEKTLQPLQSPFGPKV